MRTALAMVVGWLAVTGLAVGVAVGAVGLVSDSMTADRPRALSAAAVSAALARSESPLPAVTETSTTQTSTTAPPATATTQATATTRATAGTTPSSTATTGGTVPVVAAVEERTYRLQGGQARIRFAPSGATIVSASPEPGFTMEQKQHSGGEVEVRFRSDDHESRLRASWNNGPQAEIDED